MEEDIKIIRNQILEFNQTKEYANEFQVRFYQAIENLLTKYKNLVEIEAEHQKENGELRKEKICLHCGKNVAGYCESCYQELIGENAKLQLELKEDKEKTLFKGIDTGSGEDQTAFMRFIPENLIKFKLAEAEAKLKIHIEVEGKARGNNKPIATYVKMQKLISEIEIYKELLGESNDNHIPHID